MHGAGGILQGKESGVLLYIPKGINAFVYGHVHTDPGPFLQEIPEDHCLVAPIVEYHYVATEDIRNKQCWFKIIVPHCVTEIKKLGQLEVWHGNIKKNSHSISRGNIVSAGLEYTAVGDSGINERGDLKYVRTGPYWSNTSISHFTQLPTSNSYFQVNDKYITIHTRHFSQFICTSCNKICKGRGNAFIFGRVTPRKTISSTASLRMYVCSPLHSIIDYKKVSILMYYTIILSTI